VPAAYQASTQHQTLVLRLEHRTLERAIDFEQAGADVNHVDWGGFSALHRAAFDGQVEAAKVLLDAGAKVNCQDVVGGRTPLHQAAGCPLPRFPFQCGYMMTNGSICRTTAGSIREEVLADDQGVVARAGEGQTKMCELLIARGADAHIKDYPCTPEVRWRGPLREGEASGLDLSAVCPCISRALNVSADICLAPTPEEYSWLNPDGFVPDGLLHLDLIYQQFDLSADVLPADKGICQPAPGWLRDRRS